MVEVSVQGFTPVLNKLGVVKNQLLVFIMLSAIIINTIAVPLAYSSELWKEISGVCLHVTSAIMLIGFGAFYAFALFSLPANEQQLQFQRTVDRTIEEHHESKAVPTRRKRTSV